MGRFSRLLPRGQPEMLGFCCASPFPVGRERLHRIWHNPLLIGHELYKRLGRTPADRQNEYRALFRAALDDGFVNGLSAASNRGWALGDARFKQQIAKALGRRVVPLPKGRPPKAPAERRQLSLL